MRCRTTARRRKPAPLGTLTRVQRERLVRLVLGGATVGNEETMIVDLLETAPSSDLAPIIDHVRFRWLWDDLGGSQLERLVHRVGPRYWAQQAFDAKDREIKFHAAGVTTERSEEMIIVILRTCSAAQVRLLAKKHDLDWSLDGKEQQELERLRR